MNYSDIIAEAVLSCIVAHAIHFVAVFKRSFEKVKREIIR